MSIDNIPWQPPMVIRAAAYIRVSTQEQKMHGLSLDAQQEKLQAYADAHGLQIVQWYRDEGVSGRKPIAKRPELQRMITDAEAGRFSTIIFIKLDRFFRSVGEYHECMKRLGSVTWAATEEKYSLADANGRAFVHMKLTIAELEADQTGERIRLVNEYKAKAGIPVVPTRCLPFYFQNEKRTMVKRNQEAIMDLIEWEEVHHSIRGGMTYINNKYNLGLTYRAVANALRNPLLCGEYRGNPNFCEGYITRERFAALQESLFRQVDRETKYDYIFQGLIVCPECGRRLAGAMHHSVNGKYRYTYMSYRCPQHRISKSCSFSACVFEKAVEELMISRVQADLSRYSISGTAGTADQQEVLNIEQMRSELTRVNYAWEKGRLTPEEYDQKYESLTERIRQAEEYNRSLSQVPRIYTTLPADWQDAYNELSSAGKRAFWKSLVESIHISWSKDCKQIDHVQFSVT